MEVVQALFSRGYQVKHVEKHRQSYRLLEISGKPLERVNLLFVVPSHLAARPALKSSWVG